MTIDENAPVRLEDIIPIAFPAGGITLAGLRKEVARGNLAVEKIAGKLFTTLADIKRMREKCRVKEKVLASGNDLPGREDVNPSGLSETETTALAQESLLNLLKSDPPRPRKKR
jgi:hypothetical protein